MGRRLGRRGTEEEGLLVLKTGMQCGGRLSMGMGLKDE